MFRSRRIESLATWSDADGIKIYTVSARHQTVDQSAFVARLAEVKTQKALPWSSIPAFVIFHEGTSALYLVLAWWGNDNELFTSVSAKTESGWVEDPARYSVCVWDLEIIWQERNYFVEMIYCSKPSLEAYRAKRFGQGS